MELLAKLFYRSYSVVRAMRSLSSATAKDAREAPRTVTLRPDTSAQIEDFAVYFNIPVEDAVNKAVAEWMETTGNVMLAYTENARRKTEARPKLTLVKPLG